MKKLVLFASGSGSNVENIANYFSSNSEVEIVEVFTNNPNAFVINRCENLGIPCTVFTRDEFVNSDIVLNKLLNLAPDLIVLAGFLWKVPSNLVSNFPNKIINIHPALLPKFGGKGMYGDNVHKAVVEAKESKSGITIHYVNEHYDEGAPIFQAEIPVLETDTHVEVAKKVHALEYEHFPKVIEKLLFGN